MSNKRNKHQGHQQATNRHENPTNSYEIKWPAIYPVRIELAPEDKERYANEQTGRDSQRRIGIALNIITALGTSVALVGLVYLFGSLKAAKTAAEIAQKTLLFDQRAWVGVQGAQDAAFSIPDGFLVTVVFSNSGKTPAHNVQSSVGYRTSSTSVSGPTKEDIAALEFRPAQSIAPQSRYNMRIGKKEAGEGETPHQKKGDSDLRAQLPDIQKGNLVLYYYGIIKYDDIFHIGHETQFCIYLADPKTNRIGMCDAFNDLN